MRPRIVLCAVLSLPLWFAGVGEARAQDPQKKSLEQALKNLESPTTSVRLQAIIQIRTMSPAPKEALPALYRALRDPEEAVRFAAVFAVNVIGPDEKGIAPLVEALRDTPASDQVPTSNVIQIALLKLGAEDRKKAVDALARVIADEKHTDLHRQRAMRVVGQLDQARGLPLLVKMLGHDRAAFRQQAVATLELLNSPALARELNPALTRVLDDPDAVVRLTALRTLLRFEQDEERTLALARRGLKHADLIQFYVVPALNRVGDKARPVWVEMLRHPEVAARRAAAVTLARSKDGTADLVPEFRRALKDDDGQVRVQAAGALWRFDKKSDEYLDVLLRGLDADSLEAGQAVATLLTMKDDARPILLARLDGKSPAERRLAIRGLARVGHGDAAVSQKLFDLYLNDKSHAIRDAALQALATQATLPHLLEQLKEADAGKRRLAVALLRQRTQDKSPELTKAMADVLADQDPLVRLPAAAVLLARLERTDEALAVFARGLADVRADVRREAAASLAALQFQRFVPAQDKVRGQMQELLKTALKDEDLGVRVRVAAGVPSYGVGSLAEDEAVKILGDGVGSSDAETRRAAVVKLARLGTRARPATAALTGALRDTDPDIRQHALYALALSGADARPALPALVKLLKDEAAEVRQLAAQALGNLGPAAADAVPDLVRSIEDDHIDVRLRALEALGRVGPPAKGAVPRLMQTLRDENRHSGQPAPPRFQFPAPAFRPVPLPLAAGSHLLAVDALGRIGPDAAAALPQLAELATGNPGALRGAALEALQHLGPAAVPTLAKGLASRDPSERAASAAALGGVLPASGDAVAPLRAALKDDDFEVRRHAVFALGLLGPKASAAVPDLVRVLAEAPEPELRAQAALALGQIDPAADAAQKVLKAALGDADAQVRRHSAQALNRPAVKPGVVPEKYQPLVKKGLAWLARQQHPDGRWTAAGDQYPVALTATAGLALLMEGSTPGQGAYAERLRLATDWLLERNQRHGAHAGLFADPLSQTEMTRYMFGQGYAMLFLASVYENETDAHRRGRIRAALRRAVAFAEQAQNTRGGWYYISARDGGDSNEGAATLAQLQGLLAVQHAGIPVPRAVLNKARKYLEDITEPRGGIAYSVGGPATAGSGRPALTAAALACAGGPWDLPEPLVKRWWKFGSETVVTGVGRPGGYDEWAHFYYAQAAYRLGEDGWAKRFPDDNGGKVIWSVYRDRVLDDLLKQQKDDGSWVVASGYGVGPVYTTALYLTIAQMDRAAVPLFRR
jgi:HEAT repeat protein